MSGVLHTTTDQLPPELQWEGELMIAGIESLQPVLDYYQPHFCLVQIALHQPGGEPFFLLAQHDGPYLAVSPITEDAAALLLAAVPRARAWQKSGVPAWANRQRWEAVIGTDLYRTVMGGYASYDPRLPIPADAAYQPTTSRTPEEGNPCV